MNLVFIEMPDRCHSVSSPKFQVPKLGVMLCIPWWWKVDCILVRRVHIVDECRKKGFKKVLHLRHSLTLWLGKKRKLNHLSPLSMDESLQLTFMLQGLRLYIFGRDLKIMATHRLNFKILHFRMGDEIPSMIEEWKWARSTLLCFIQIPLSSFNHLIPPCAWEYAGEVGFRCKTLPSHSNVGCFARKPTFTAYPHPHDCRWNFHGMRVNLVVMNRWKPFLRPTYASYIRHFAGKSVTWDILN